MKLVFLIEKKIHSLLVTVPPSSLPPRRSEPNDCPLFSQSKDELRSFHTLGYSIPLKTHLWVSSRVCVFILSSFVLPFLYLMQTLLVFSGLYLFLTFLLLISIIKTITHFCLIIVPWNVCKYLSGIYWFVSCLYMKKK